MVIKRQSDDTDGSKPRIKQYQLGEYYYGIVSDDQFFQSFSQDKDNNVLFSTSSSINVIINAVLPKQYYYYWYLIPALKNDVFYYIEEFTYITDEFDNVLTTELTLKKVDDELENVVDDKNLLITPSFSNELYAWPKLEPNTKYSFLEYITNLYESENAFLPIDSKLKCSYFNLARNE